MKLISALLAATIFLTACSEQEDEEQIAETMAAIEEAIEAKDFTEIEKYLHSSFVANERMDIEEVGQLLQLYSLQHKRLDVTLVGSTTTMHQNYSDRADSYVSVIVTGSSRFLPSDGSIRHVEVEWIKESGDWLIRRAVWRR